MNKLWVLACISQIRLTYLLWMKTIKASMIALTVMAGAVLLTVYVKRAFFGVRLPFPIASFPFNVSIKNSFANGRFNIVESRTYIIELWFPFRSDAKPMHSFLNPRPAEGPSEIVPIQLEIRKINYEPKRIDIVFKQELLTTGSSAIIHNPGGQVGGFITRNIANINLDPGSYIMSAINLVGHQIPLEGSVTLSVAYDAKVPFLGAAQITKSGE